MRRLLGRFPWTSLFLAALTLTEAAVIWALILPYPSQREDWLVGTLVIAPIATLVLMVVITLPLRVTAGVIAFIRRRLEHD